MRILQKAFIAWMFFLVAFASVLLYMYPSESFSATSRESFSEAFGPYIGPYIKQLFSFFS
jgi:hypothetical protein